MIPLRDANPTRRTPVVTLALIAACFVIFAYELGRLGSGGMEALDAFATEWGIVPAELTAAWASGDEPGWRGPDPDHQPVPPRRLAAPPGEHAVPVDLRQ